MLVLWQKFDEEVVLDEEVEVHEGKFVTSGLSVN
jgi:hypothetical protein